MMVELATVRVAQASLRNAFEDDLSWLQAPVAEAARAFDGVLQAFAFHYELAPDGAGPRPVAFVGGAESLHTLTDVSMDALTDDSALRFTTDGQCTTAREIFGTVPERVQEGWREHGIGDAFALLAGHPTVGGVGMTVVVETPPTLGVVARRDWRETARVLGLVARLRSALGERRLDEIPHLRFSPSGRCLHATEGLESRTLRSGLREWVANAERARALDMRGESVELKDVWRGLVSGGWLLADQFDSDGTRHVVLVPHPGGSSRRALTGQQQAVAEAVGRGLSNRRVARQLGMSERAVATQLRRAMIKLGLRRRVELVRVFSTLVPPS